MSGLEKLYDMFNLSGSHSTRMFNSRLYMQFIQARVQQTSEFLVATKRQQHFSEFSSRRQPRRVDRSVVSSTRLPAIEKRPEELITCARRRLFVSKFLAENQIVLGKPIKSACRRPLPLNTTSPSTTISNCLPRAIHPFLPPPLILSVERDARRHD